eukprot:gb/GFBE01076421.1/.p1 GENE.gb/GFBE01076421.1/~~gb/GFBE01076421.1/.p1  ORF type:complete len:348 (+),score=79.61 gb/GFBE01076421.1/:1-1044(+)
MSVELEGDAAPSPVGIGGIDPDHPCNPGSRDHPNGCKPCNKYNPNRPNDSCKHALTCAFCHGREHERPKHRGQRGRHALQRRQYLESRESMNEELREYVDEVYRVPPKVMEKIKERLQGMETAAREQQVQLLVERIAHIGDQAQHQRPDSTRVRGVRMETQEYTAPSDLDSRFKWLTGTLHLMIRKMWDNDSKEESEKLKEIKESVERILKQCEELPAELDLRLQRWGGLQDQVDKMAEGERRAWLRQHLTALAKAELIKGPDSVQKSLDGLGELLDQLPSLADESDEVKQKLQSCASLEEMHSTLEDLIETIKDRILGLDYLEEFEDGALLADMSCPSRPDADIRF